MRSVTGQGECAFLSLLSTCSCNSFAKIMLKGNKSSQVKRSRYVHFAIMVISVKIIIRRQLKCFKIRRHYFILCFQKLWPAPREKKSNSCLYKDSCITWNINLSMIEIYFDYFTVSIKRA